LEVRLIGGFKFYLGGSIRVPVAIPTLDIPPPLCGHGNKCCSVQQNIVKPILFPFPLFHECCDLGDFVKTMGHEYAHVADY